MNRLGFKKGGKKNVSHLEGDKHHSRLLLDHLRVQSSPPLMGGVEVAGDVH